MIFGDYPCCEGPLTLSIPDGVEAPVIQREICPHCGAVVWHKLSRFDPESWTDARFRELYDVDDETKAVKPKGAPTEPLPPALQAMFDAHMDRAIAETARSLEQMLMKGTGQ